VCSLTTNRQRAAMSQPSVTTDVHQTLDVHLDTFAEIALNFTLRFEDASDTTQLVLTQVLNAGVKIYSSFL
jgi:hypothetical protein